MATLVMDAIGAARGGVEDDFVVQLLADSVALKVTQYRYWNWTGRPVTVVLRFAPTGFVGDAVIQPMAPGTKQTTNVAKPKQPGIVLTSYGYGFQVPGLTLSAE